MQTFQPYIDQSIDPHVRTLLNLVFQKLNNHAQAITKIKPGTTVTNETVVNEGGTGGGSGTSTVVGGVNNQTGQTAYTTQPSDNGVFLVLSDASPVAVTLSTGVAAPWFLFSANQGAGTVTFTPTSGTINGGATLTLLQGYGVIIFFDGANFWSLVQPLSPVTFTAVTHEFLTAYDATTRTFTAAQPAYSDLTGVPTLPATIAAVAGKYLTGYDASTGLFSQSTTAGISVTITTAALTPTGTQGSMTFTNGILTAQVQAT